MLWLIGLCVLVLLVLLYYIFWGRVMSQVEDEDDIPEAVEVQMATIVTDWKKFKF